MAKTTKVCKRCGREIPKDAKICPACGRLPKLPFYRRWWFIVLVIILIMWMANLVFGGPTDTPEEAREYTAVTVDQLYDELDDNALKAEDTYQDAYVAVKGLLGKIDSDGGYIGSDKLDDTSLENVHCRLVSDEQREAVKSHSRGDEIIVKGKMTDIGEIQGYTMTVDSIE